MEFNKETFEKALKANKIVRYQRNFEDVVKSYLEIENQALRQTAVSGWVAVTDALPKPLQTVWLTNGKGWCSLGCLVESDGGLDGEVCSCD